MKLSKSLSSCIYIMFIVLALSGAFLISKNNERPLIFVSKQQSTLNINENFWLYFNLGQKRLLASLYWIATILESDVDHYKDRDLNSWMFIRFNTISLLEPKFYENYNFGGPYLSVIKDDLQGASILYQKGLQHYPDDYSLLLNSGFHYYFELRDIDTAYPILRRLRNNPKTPQYMISSLARIESKRGNLMDSFLILKEYKTRFEEGSIISNKINEQLYSLKAEMDLICLNSGQSNCAKSDYEGNSYILKNNTFVAPKEWKIYRPKWNKK